MPTEKLYWADPFATTFDARADLGNLDGKRTVVLDRTLFYPEAGGQLADAGTLAFGDRTLRVEDVQIDGAGVIHHLVADAPAELGLASASARGAIDAERRRDMMAQHTAQHALSRALVDVARADTVSSRLGATACTVDVDGALSERDVARAEDLVNSVVTSDVVVRALYPTAEELARMPLRRAPKVDRDVRVIEIDGFDLSPCGGTHCTRSGQIGAVRVVAFEKYKGGWRVTFHAGKRAIDDARRKEAALAEIARELTCGIFDVGAALTKLRADMKARSDALGLARGELVELLSERVLAAHPPAKDGPTRVVVIRPHDDVAALRTLAGRLAARPDVVAFCASPDDRGEARDAGWAIVVQRGAGATFDCGAWLKAVASEKGGRGGGRPERAEGRLPKDVDVEALVRSASEA